jgi:hypothetical protein
MPWGQIQAPPDLIHPTNYCLRIQFDETAAIKRTWGPRAKGIAADITLDKDTFRVGKDVRVHLTVERTLVGPATLSGSMFRMLQAVRYP